MADRSNYTGKLLDTAGSFAICAGTVPLDVAHRRALVLHDLPTNEYLLSKGHKDAGETLEAAAIRETEEELGYACKLLPHSLATNATELKGKQHTEPIAVQQRTRDGIRKLIFWYVTSVTEKDKTKQQLGDGEDFETVWVVWDELDKVLTFEDDRKIASCAVGAVTS